MEKKNRKDNCEEQLFHVYVKPAPPPVVSLNERACVCVFSFDAVSLSHRVGTEVRKGEINKPIPKHSNGC